MTEFRGLVRNLMSEKWRMMNWIIIVDLIFLVISNLFVVATGGWKMVPFSDVLFQLFVISLSVANFVGFILLSRNNERVFTSNNYRLIPASDTKLYFSNFLTTTAAFIYLQILEIVLGTIIYFISKPGNLSLSPSRADAPVLILFSVLLLGLLSMILMWTAITSIHFIINWISNFLPFARQKFVSFILYIVVAMLGITIFNYTTGKVFSAIYLSPEGVLTLNQLSTVIWIGIGISLLWIAIFTVLNIYLLKRWTETIR